jgi:hypothetical protein
MNAIDPRWIQARGDYKSESDLGNFAVNSSPWVRVGLWICGVPSNHTFTFASGPLRDEFCRLFGMPLEMEVDLLPANDFKEAYLISLYYKTSALFQNQLERYSVVLNHLTSTTYRQQYDILTRCMIAMLPPTEEKPSRSTCCEPGGFNRIRLKLLVEDTFVLVSDL